MIAPIPSSHADFRGGVSVVFTKWQIQVTNRHNSERDGNSSKRELKLTLLFSHCPHDNVNQVYGFSNKTAKLLQRRLEGGEM